MAGTAVFQSGTLATPGAGIVVATDSVSGTQYQLVKWDIGPAGTSIPVAYGGTGLPLGTLPGGSVGVVGTLQVLGTVQLHGTTQTLGTFQPLAGSVHLASRLPGTADIGTIAGTVSILGTVQTHGTSQVLGTLQPLAGSVHPAAALPGTSHITGTVQPLAGSVHLASGTVQVLGTLQTHGTTQALGTFQPLAGSAHLATNLAGGTVVAVGSALHGAAADTRPLLMAAFGSSGTQAAVDDGDVARLWSDLNGRLQVRGTIDSLPAISGTVQTHGTSQVLGTFQPLAGSVHPAAALPGTSHITGTVQPLAGSVHLASGTVSVLGTLQPLAGSVHVANTVSGTVQVHGTVPVGTVAGTVSVLGTVQPLAGSVHVAAPITGTVQTHGTSQVLGSVQAVGTMQTRPAGVAGESFIGTIFTGAAFSTAAVLVNPAAGTFVRLFDVLISGSAAGTVRLEFGSASGTLIAPLFLAANGGWSMNSARGVLSPGTSKGLYVTASAGTWGVMINYALEN